MENVFIRRTIGADALFYNCIGTMRPVNQLLLERHEITL